MVNRNGGSWDGGYVSVGKGGRRTYFIERSVRGERFHVSTRCHTTQGAMAQLKRFEGDPRNYTPEGVEVADTSLRMTTELLLEFRTWSIDTRGNTRKHANEMYNRLVEWLEDLKGKDLRRLTLGGDLLPAIDRRLTCRPHRIIAIKSFFKWLRTKAALVTHAEDATLDLPVPQSVPEKWKRRKAVGFDVVQAAMSRLGEGYQDALWVLTGTGWHVTELCRFVRQPESEIVLIPAKPGELDETTDAKGNRVRRTLAVLRTKHKNKERTRTPIQDAGVLAAAQRAKARGTVPRYLNRALSAACLAAEVPAFGYGVMRHSVATWALENGASPDDVSKFLQHKDRRTTERFYADVAAPTPRVDLPTFTVINGGKSAANG
jgi:integrase